jgi:hypothetical protein
MQWSQVNVLNCLKMSLLGFLLLMVCTTAAFSAPDDFEASEIPQVAENTSAGKSWRDVTRGDMLEWLERAPYDDYDHATAIGLEQLNAEALSWMQTTMTLLEVDGPTFVERHIGRLLEPAVPINSAICDGSNGPTFMAMMHWAPVMFQALFDRLNEGDFDSPAEAESWVEGQIAANTDLPVRYLWVNQRSYILWLRGCIWPMMLDWDTGAEGTV